MKHERNARLLRKSRLAARKHHAQLIVFDRVRGEKLRNGGDERPFALVQTAKLWCKRARCALAAQNVYRAVLCGRHEPRGWIVGYAAQLPNLQRAAEGVLNDVFC